MRCSISILVLVLVVSCSSHSPKVKTADSTTTLDSAALAEDAFVRGRQFYEADQLDSALAWYTRGTELNPTDARLWHGKGATLGRLKRHEEALAALDEAIRLQPIYTSAIWHRACENASHFDKDEALADLRRAIELDKTIRQAAKEDSCFYWLWDDTDFLAVTE